MIEKITRHVEIKVTKHSEKGEYLFEQKGLLFEKIKKRKTNTVQNQ